MSIITKKALPRRTFLRGIGASFALPLLDAMVPSMTALPKSPADPVRRLGFVYMPMGSDIARWTPAGEGPLGELSPALQSLKPVIDQLTVITNLELKNAYPGTHATSNAAFLSAAKAKWTESTDYHLGTTVDQIAAQQIGQQTVLPSGDPPAASIGFPSSTLRRRPTASNFSSDRPSGSIRLWHAAHLASLRCSASRLRTDRFPSTVLSFNVGTSGSGGGGGTPRILSRIHLPRSTGDVLVA